MPGWMSSVEGRTPAGAARLGFVLSVANPKELAFTIGAGLTIGGAGFPVTETVPLALGYTVVACLTVIVPAVAFVVSRERVIDRSDAPGPGWSRTTSPSSARCS